MLSELGTHCLILLLPVAVYAAGMMLIGARYRDAKLYRAGTIASFAVTGLLTLASALLIAAFVRNDFSIIYVQEYSNRALPLFYKVAGLWAGLDGSLMFWAWLLSIMGSIALFTLRHRLPRHLPYINLVVMLILAFFALILLFVANPFATSFAIPFDGKGLNPLLQAPEMVIHPPMLYLGYVSGSIPFAIIVAGLLAREMDETWLAAVRRWMIVCWFFLSVGNLLGMYWAYVELGWGGFWAWDPVENAAIMPWFIATAALHSIIIQERRGLFKLWTVCLGVLVYLLTIFGTFLTRSGIVQSVHAFSNSTLGVYFACFLALSMVASFTLIWRRRHLLSSGHHLETMISKEGMFLLNTIFLTLGSFAILVGTMLPTISEWIGGARLTLGPSFFNKVMTPFGIALLLLAGFGPIMAWRRGARAQIWRSVRGAACVGVAAGVLAFIFGVRDIFATSAIAAGSFALAITLGELLRGVRRIRNPLPTQLPRNMQRRLGGYIVHLGMLSIMLGFVGAVYQAETSVHLKEGEKIAWHGYDITFNGLRYKSNDNLEAVAGELALTKGGRSIATLYPARFFYKLSEQPTTEVDIHHALTHDFYTIMGAFEVDDHSAEFKFFYNPFVSCLWWGGIILILGTMVVCWPGKKSEHAPS